MSDGGGSSATTDATGAARLLQKLAVCANGAQCRLPSLYAAAEPATCDGEALQLVERTGPAGD
eukprot:4947777-Lingulodinium_polyedra.AAC.1